MRNYLMLRQNRRCYALVNANVYAKYIIRRNAQTKMDSMNEIGRMH